MEKASVLVAVFAALVRKHPALIAADFAFGFAFGWLVCHFMQ
jgi:uncharacterized membrane protein YciS (DUF1049 family)